MKSIWKPSPRPERPRKQMKRSEMKRSGFIERREPLPPVNRKRKAALTLRNFGTPAFREWTKRQPCAICGEAPRQHWNRESWGNDIAHVKTRGAGADWTLTIAACPPCHDAGKPDGEYALAREHQKRWAAEQSVTQS